MKLPSPGPGAALLACCLLRLTACWAIDNPDSPDLLGTFQARCLQYESAIQAQTTTAQIASASASYASFLDQELNRSYSRLLKRVSGSAHDALVGSQRRWLQYRNAETAFIETNWTLDNFGTSAALSRGQYRALLVRQRVETLLQYLRNYGGP